jgi:hypothetical protein
MTARTSEMLSPELLGIWIKSHRIAQGMSQEALSSENYSTSGKWFADQPPK